MGNKNTKNQAAVTQLGDHGIGVMIAGVFSIALGVVSMLLSPLAGVVSIEFLGTLLIVAGVVQFVQVFRHTSWTNRFTSLIVSSVYVMGGMITAADPMESAIAVTLILAFAFMASGVTKALIVLEQNPKKGKAWLYTSAAMSFIVGVLILTPWPQGSLTCLGFLVSLELIFTGASYLGLGLNSQLILGR